MELILKFAPKPSDAVLAMINGLEEHDKREEFEIDMESFGMRRFKPNTFGGGSYVCIGCAATCALQKMTGITLNQENICGAYARANTLGIPDPEMMKIEMMYESLRRGDASVLYGLYKVGNVPHFSLPHMKNDNWRLHLPVFKEYWSFLKKLKL